VTLPTQDTLDVVYYSYVPFLRRDQIQSQIFAIAVFKLGQLFIVPS
jgi:hypothetical protein